MGDSRIARHTDCLVGDDAYIVPQYRTTKRACHPEQAKRAEGSVLQIMKHINAFPTAGATHTKMPRQGFLPGGSNYLTKNVRIVVL